MKKPVITTYYDLKIGQNLKSGTKETNRPILEPNFDLNAVLKGLK